MKLLFDQNLSPRLVRQLEDLFPGSSHVQAQGFASSPDTPLWEFARKNDFVIVSKDVDFSDRSALLGYPPKIIWIRMGNCSTSEIEGSLRKHHGQIDAFASDDNVGVLAIFG